MGLDMIQRFRNSWKRYYYLRSPGDVLIFFDYASLTQWKEGSPRSLQQEVQFRDALKHMGTLYNCFPVCVLDYVPENLKLFGVWRLTYFEKGWCWAEANTAYLGESLDLLSSDIKEVVVRERTEIGMEMARDGE